MKKVLVILFALLATVSCKKDTDPSPQPPANSTYNITYLGNGHTGGVVPVDQHTYSQGSTAVVLGNTGTLVRTGYTFTGWNLKSDGTGTNYNPGSSITINNASIKLYAKWQAVTTGVTYKVTYDGNGNSSGTVPVDNTQYTPGSLAQVKANTGGLSKGGNAFVNWNTTPAGTGQTLLPNQQITMNSNQTLYAIYSATPPPPPPPATSGKYYGFNSSGQMKRKFSLTSSWTSEDLNNTFGSSYLVTAVWNGAKYVGFNASGQVRSKSSLTSPWVTEDFNNDFGSSTLVAVVWNGSQYIGFNASGQVKRKSSLTSPWVTEDLNHDFGSSLVVDVVWNGSEYVGFNASGQVKKKSSLTSPWTTVDLNNDFGFSLVVDVEWNGSQYIGFNASGQVKRKSALTSPWVNEDLANDFGSSLLVTAVYH